MQFSKSNSVICLFVNCLSIARLAFGVLPLFLSRFVLRISILREASSLRQPPTMMVSIRFINQRRALLCRRCTRDCTSALGRYLFVICDSSCVASFDFGIYSEIIQCDYWFPTRQRSSLISSVGKKAKKIAGPRWTEKERCFFLFVIIRMAYRRPSRH